MRRETNAANKWILPANSYSPLVQRDEIDEGWRVRKKTHASSPSTSGKTHEKTCPIQTRRDHWVSSVQHERYNDFITVTSLVSLSLIFLSLPSLSLLFPLPFLFSLMEVLEREIPLIRPWENRKVNHWLFLSFTSRLINRLLNPLLRWVRWDVRKRERGVWRIDSWGQTVTKIHFSSSPTAYEIFTG